ncbi:hypothetical protein K435DRAFT_785947 [Dendrothele bispora CBS 962.96]|uniref:Uncharacterized protein n=1 Tax=Dendrothele bispora (strain CBS 962.96) TaxID=1314807 RepID=A0A4S8KTL2_DENBC|nr:hypothetical protein K435DRAFT_785947 [Dendrothele bispora CBS 962.96]
MSYSAMLLSLFSFVTIITLFTLVTINRPYSSGHNEFSSVRRFIRACEMHARHLRRILQKFRV